MIINMSVFICKIVRSIVKSRASCDHKPREEDNDINFLTDMVYGALNCAHTLQD